MPKYDQEEYIWLQMRPMHWPALTCVDLMGSWAGLWLSVRDFTVKGRETTHWCFNLGNWLPAIGNVLRSLSKVFWVFIFMTGNRSIQNLWYINDDDYNASTKEFWVFVIFNNSKNDKFEMWNVFFLTVCKYAWLSFRHSIFKMIKSSFHSLN